MYVDHRFLIDLFLLMLTIINVGRLATPPRGFFFTPDITRLACQTQTLVVLVTKPPYSCVHILDLAVQPLHCKTRTTTGELDSKLFELRLVHCLPVWVRMVAQISTTKIPTAKVKGEANDVSTN